MKLTGPACTEAMSEAEEAGTRERAEGNAGGVRVERVVRPARTKEPTRARGALVFTGERAVAKTRLGEPEGKELELVRKERERCAGGQFHDASEAMGRRAMM